MGYELRISLMLWYVFYIKEGIKNIMNKGVGLCIYEFL